MRPQKLSLKNFMPFRVTGDLVHEVDFSRLDLFSITGPMASGKSALIDAIVWCLYGRTARYGADSKGVISAGEGTCEVALDFTVGERWFRAVRRTGKMTESGLSEREGDEWIQDKSGSALLTKRIEELLGLDFDSFTKTVILPQGRYAEFLTSEPKKRRDLLAKILELGVYARVADQAKVVAGQAKTRAETLRETLTPYAGLSLEHIELQKGELAQLVQRIEQVTQQAHALQGVVQQVDQVVLLRNRVAEFETEIQARTQEQAQAKVRVDETVAQVASLASAATKIIQAREALGYDATRHEVVKRADVHIKEWLLAQHEAEQKNSEHVHIQEEVEALRGQITAHTQKVENLQTQYQSNTTAFEQLIAEAGDVAVLTEKLGAAKRWKELQREQRQLTTRIDELRQKQASTQQTLDEVTQQESIYAQAVVAIKEQLVREKEDEQQKRQLMAEAELLGRELQAAAQAEKRIRTEYEEAGTALTQAEKKVKDTQQTLLQDEEQERVSRTTLENNQRQHDALHLRKTLHVGESCPVCQARVNELPTVEETDEDVEKLQAQMERIRQAADITRQAVQEAQAAVASLQARLDTAEPELKERKRTRQEVQDRFVARFPGHTSLAEALEALQRQQQELRESLKNVEAQVREQEKKKEAATRQREATLQESAKFSEALRVAVERLNNEQRASDTLERKIAAFLSAGEDPEQRMAQRRTAVIQAEQKVKDAEKVLRQEESTLNRLNTTHVQKEGSLKLLASQHQDAVGRVNREAQAVRECLNVAADAALPNTTDVEDELRMLSQEQTEHAQLSQQEEKIRVDRDRAERRAAEVQADLQARTRMLGESQERRWHASDTLVSERKTLKELIAQHHLTGVGEDGENIKTQLETVRGQMISLQEHRGRLEAEHAEAERRWKEKEQEEEKLRTAETEERLASDLRKLLGSEFTDFLSRGAIEALMHDASGHLHRLTHGRYAFDIAYRGRAINLQIVDNEDQRRARPTHSLSGGETFLASLAIALALSQGFRTVATGRAAQTSTECLILDEGFGTLDREGVQMVTETLQELRGEEGRMVGIITHVEEVAAAMPMRIEVRKGGRTSEITVSG